MIASSASGPSRCSPGTTCCQRNRKRMKSCVRDRLDLLRAAASPCSDGCARAARGRTIRLGRAGRERARSSRSLRAASFASAISTSATGSASDVGERCAVTGPSPCSRRARFRPARRRASTIALREFGGRVDRAANSSASREQRVRTAAGVRRRPTSRASQSDATSPRSRQCSSSRASRSVELVASDSPSTPRCVRDFGRR